MLTKQMAGIWIKVALTVDRLNQQELAGQECDAVPDGEQMPVWIEDL